MAGVDQQSEHLLEVHEWDAPAVVTAGRTITWSELERRSRQLADIIEGAGVELGSTWSALLHDRAEWPEVAIGTARAGTRYAPLNWHLTARELAELMVDSGARLLLTEPGLRGVAREAATLAGIDHIVEVGDEYETSLDGAGHDPPTERPVGSPILYTSDGEGYPYLADRHVDLITTGGSNVYPAEIEAVLVERPRVGDVAVFGIPDPDLGQQINAVLEPVGDLSIDLDDVRSFATEWLAPLRVPESFGGVEALPREAHGKLGKCLLREPCREGRR